MRYTDTIFRGILAGIAGSGFVMLFLFAQTRLVSIPILIGIGIISVIALVGAGGFSAVQQLLGITSDTTTETQDSEPAEWWLARVEPALENSWNTWSDAILTIGLGIVGIGSFVLLVTHPSDDPPLGLLVVGFLGINGALLSLAFLIE